MAAESDLPVGEFPANTLSTETVDTVGSASTFVSSGTDSSAVTFATVATADEEKDQILYNKLPGIDSAHNNMETIVGEKLKSAMLPAVWNVLVKYGHLYSLGVWLVHNHFDIVEGEIVVEKFSGKYKAGDVLSTAEPVQRAEATDAVPTRWVLKANEDGSYSASAVEYASGIDMSRYNKKMAAIKEQPELFTELGKVFQEYNAANIVGVGYYDNTGFGEEEPVTLETNFGRKNITTVVLKAKLNEMRAEQELAREKHVHHHGLITSTIYQFKQANVN